MMASDGAQVRALLREATFATLATIDQVAAGGSTGRPYASLVEVATTVDGLPILLLSRLARHTRNILAEPRVSLLVDRRTVGATALAEPRAAIAGRLRLDASAATRSRYLRRHAQAEAYAEFGDFQFWSLQIESAHLIVGFGRIREITGAEMRVETATAGGYLALTQHLMQEEARLLTALEAEGRACGRAVEWERLVALDTEGVDVLRDGALTRLVLSDVAADAADYLEAIRVLLGLAAGGPRTI